MLSSCYIFGALLALGLSSTEAQLKCGQATHNHEFSGFFPCLPNNANITTQEDVQSCDIFVYPAAQLAFERAKMEINDSRSTRLCFDAVSVPDDVIPEFSVTQALFNIYVHFANLSDDVDLNVTFSQFGGAVGPHSNFETARQFLYILRQIGGAPMVSYGLSDARLNSYDNFYRTLPSTDILNQARLLILARFNWYRIGILGSKENNYTLEMENFRSDFQEYVEREVQAELSYEGFIEDLPSTLTELRRLDLRIILGFFGPEQSRAVLCEASSPLYKLTSPQHVWILPSYYNPDWWKDGNNTSSNCTDEEMRDILQSVIFIDPGKYPPLGTNFTYFYSELLNKTYQLFPNLLPEVQLDHLLQHSRAISAYDATLLLTRSLDQGGINTGKLDSQIMCEMCRIYPDVFLPNGTFEFCSNIRELCQDSVNANLTVNRTTILAGYGQVLISQFVNGTHCPIMMFWPSQSDKPEMLRTNFQFVHRLSELINSSDSDHELREELRASNIFPGSVGCPKNFTWKGASAPQSNTLQVSDIPVWALTLTGVLTLLGELLIAGLITFSIFWRENHHVKGTSPRLNVVILIGAAMALPQALFDGIIVSAVRYSLSQVLGTVICQFNLWIPVTGVTIFIGGISVKTFRLYRIFHNKALRMNLQHLRDRDLIISVCVLVLPVLFFLLIWNSVTPLEYTLMQHVQPDVFSYIQITSCTSTKEIVGDIMYALALFYQFLILLTTICLSMFIHRAPEAIKLDLSMLRIALFIGSLFALIAIVSDVALGDNPQEFELHWWFDAMRDSFSIVATVPVIFLYQVVLVIKDYYIKMRDNHFPKAKNLHTGYHQGLLEEIAELSESIAQKEATIKELKAR